MLKIRLSRIGKRGQAYFRVIVTEHTKKPKGEYLELLGTYNPHEKVLNIKKDRIEYWVSKGAQPSPTVNNLLVNHKIWNKPKVQSWKPKVKPKVETPAMAIPTLKAEPKVEVEVKRAEAPKVETPKEEPKEEVVATESQPAVVS